jgi:uncharacterized membrane protein
MNKHAYIQTLKEGLKGLSVTAQSEVLADTEAHFAAGLEAGRTEEEIAKGLGDPARLAREIRAEEGLKRWEMDKTPSSAVTAIIALIGLGALDILILLPLLISIAGTLISLIVLAFIGFAVGGFIFAIGGFLSLPGGIAAALLGGFGIMSLSAALGAGMGVLSVLFVNFVVWFARLHYRLIKPALAQN